MSGRRKARSKRPGIAFSSRRDQLTGVKLEIAAVTPRGLPDPAIAVAASRAGGVGVVDLSGPVPAADKGRALIALCRHGRVAACGVKLDCLDEAVTELAADLPPELGYVLVAPGERRCLIDLISRLRTDERTLLLEAVNAEEAQLAAELG